MWTKPGVRSVSASTLTGTVLILFDPDKPIDEIIALLEEIAESASHSVDKDRMPASQPRRETRDFSLPALPAIWNGLKSFVECAARQGHFISRNALSPLSPACNDQSESSAERIRQEWSLVEADDVITFWESSRTGLDSQQVESRLRKYGYNVLPQAEPRSTLAIFLGQFRSLPVVLLIGSSILSALTGGVADALVILGVVFLNAGIGALTERESERTIKSLLNARQPPALVVRDNRVQEIEGEEVVVGDLLVLTRGTYVAADARLIEVERLTVDESALTGESAPATKTARRLDSPLLPLGDRVNMIYRGTVVTGGSGLAVVVATGSGTEIGWIQSLITTTFQPETTMQRQMRGLGNQLIGAAGAACGLMFVVGLLRGYGLLEMLQSSIALAVAAIPEGLPVVATTTLAYGVKQMRERNALVRRLEAIESLGAVQVMCLDKTGTITMNRMSVVSALAGMNHYRVMGEQFFLGEEAINPLAHEELLRLIQISALCNESEVSRENGSTVIKGTPTESALAQMALDSGIDVSELRQQWSLVRTVYRTEDRNYMSTLHRAGSGTGLLAVKGAPQEVLALSRRYMHDGQVRELTEQVRSDIRAENERMAGAALRVLGLAFQEDDEVNMEQGLVWLGMVGILDPPREGLRDLIAVFRKAGIKTVMITGDQGATAYAIAKELNLSAGRQLEMIDSIRLADMDPELLGALADRAQVFSRVNPSSKLQIVQALQREGKVVAMTGDGINDGPALKASDIGVAMGKGSEVAREVADIILLDDRLETMISAIEQGRTIYDDIKKSIHFIAATNLSEIMVMIGAVGAGMGQPLNPRQLLWINLLTDVLPELALAVEPPETDVLNRPPRDPSAPIIAPSEFRRIGIEAALITGAALTSYGVGFARYGMGPPASTMAFLSLTSAILLHTISSRSEHHTIFDRERLPDNKYIPIAIGAGFAVELLSEFVPTLRRILGTARLGVGELLICGGTALASFTTNEVLKLVERYSLKPAELEAGAEETAPGYLGETYE
jgi:Ca2+-transporting ATPase